MAYEDFKDFAFEEPDDPRTSYRCDYNDENDIDAKIEPIKEEIKELTGSELEKYYNWLEKLMDRASFIDHLWWALRNVDTSFGQRVLQSCGVIHTGDGWNHLRELKRIQKQKIAEFNEKFYKDGEGYLARKMTYRWLDEHCKKRHKRFMEERREKGVFYRFHDLDCDIR